MRTNSAMNTNGAIFSSTAQAQPQVSGIKALTLQKAVAMLRAAGCQFAIIDETGQTYGTLQVAQPEPMRTPKKRKYHGVTDFIRSQIADTPVGGSAMVIPNEQFPLEAISTTTASTCIRLWGSGNFKTHCNGEAVEVLRFL